MPAEGTAANKDYLQLMVPPLIIWLRNSIPNLLWFLAVVDPRIYLSGTPLMTDIIISTNVWVMF